MIVNTREMTGVAVDWAMAYVEGEDVSRNPMHDYPGTGRGLIRYNPSENMETVGRLMQKHRLSLLNISETEWEAQSCCGLSARGETLPLAICRVILLKHLGEVVTFPLRFER